METSRPKIKNRAVQTYQEKKTEEYVEKMKEKYERESQADRAVKLCLEEAVELFCDQHKTAYARIKNVFEHIVNDANDATDNTSATYTAHQIDYGSLSHGLENKEGSETQVRVPVQVAESSTLSSLASLLPKGKEYFEIVQLRSSHFKSYVAHLMYDTDHKVINSEALSSALNVLEYKATHGVQVTLYNRVAPDPQGNGIWLDTANKLNQAYHITKEGWKLVDSTDIPLLFKRFEHQKALANAQPNGDAWKILNYLNIRKEPVKVSEENTSLTVEQQKEQEEKIAYIKRKRLLLMVQIASYILPNIAHPISALYGPAGTYKSSSQKYVRGIFDASSVPLLSYPKDETALIQQLEHHWMPIYDNLSSLPQWFSNALCRAVTGEGQEVRQLYTDNGVIIREFRRCPMINGINLPAQQGDLLDRTIPHETIPEVNRKTEAELNTAYENDRGEILGGFLDATVKALNLIDAVKPKKLFRLADFTIWGCALAEALGGTSEEFIKAYDDVLMFQNEETVHASAVATAFIEYCSKDVRKDDFTDSPSNVFSGVENRARQLNINTKQRSWPKTPQSFSRELNKARAAIAAAGWEYEVIPGTQRKMHIWANKVEPHKEVISVVRAEIQLPGVCPCCGTIKSLEYEILYADKTKITVCFACGESYAVKLAEAAIL
jgi:hypothetical protein